MIKTILDNECSDKVIKQIEMLFNQEYTDAQWTRNDPYGYSPASVRTLVFDNENNLVGHIGAEQRMISVGGTEVSAAGIGGVLVAPGFRNQKLAQNMMRELKSYFKYNQTADYAYLGCREEVVRFYESCGFTRIYRTETFLENFSHKKIVRTGDPILVSAINNGIADFPKGYIDIRGTAW